MKLTTAIAELQLLYLEHGEMELKHPIDWEFGFSEITKVRTWVENDKLICYFE